MNAAVDTIDKYIVDKNKKIDFILSQLRSTGWLKDSQGRSRCFQNATVCLAVELELVHSDSELCDYFPAGKRDLDVIDVLNTIASLGCLGNEISILANSIDSRLFPCLYVPSESHRRKNKDSEKVLQPVVILSSQNKDGLLLYSVFDCLSERVLTIDSRDIESGKAYVFTKESESPQPLSPDYMAASGFSWFRALLERFKSLFWQVFSASIMINLVAISAPLFVMLVYDRVIGLHAPETLMPLIVGAFLALICEGVLRFVRLRSLSWFSSRVDTIVSNQIFSQLIFMPITFTERASVSAQISRIRAFESIRDFFNGTLFLSIVELPFTIIILAAIGLIAGSLALIPLFVAFFYIVLLYFTGTQLRTATNISGKCHALRQQMTFETFQKMHGIRASGISEQWIEAFRKVSGKASLSAFNTAFLSARIEMISHALFVAAGLAIIFFGVSEIIAGNITTGALIATTLLVWRVLTPFKILCNSISRFEQVKNSVDQVNRLMAINTEAQESASATRISDLKGHVSFSKIGIRYNKKSDPVFTGLSFVAKPGELVAVTGGNGSGKSTILQLVNGFYKPQAGNIRIDGLDIRQLDLMELRKSIAYVPQVPHFFNGTIAENLRMADPLVSAQAMKVVLNQVDAWEDICALPKGIETRIGIDGYQLPSGISYKLNLARAYIKNTSLMLFDELPYSLLNSSAGDAFRTTIQSWKGHRTVILVTHREDYIKMADTVVLLTAGEFPIVGSPDLVIEAINKSNGEA